jgi:hypothetical protein
MLFSSVCWKNAISSNYSAASSCALSFLLSSLGGITRLVYLQMSRFSSFPQFWLLRCSWERWVILLQYGCMTLGTFLLLFSLAGFCTFARGALTGILHLYARTTLLHCFAFWVRVFTILSGPSLCIPSQHKNTEFALFCFEFFIAQKSSIAFGRGESEWMTYELDYAPRRNGFTDIYSDDVMSAHNDVQVYTGGGLLHFASYSTWPSEDIHVCLPPQRHPSRRYVLLLDA